MKIYDIISEAKPKPKPPATPKPTLGPDGRWGFVIDGKRIGAFRDEASAKAAYEKNPERFKPAPAPKPTPEPPKDTAPKDKPEPPKDKPAPGPETKDKPEPPKDTPPKDKPAPRDRRRPKDVLDDLVKRKKISPAARTRWERQTAVQFQRLTTTGVSGALYKATGRIAAWAPWFEFIDDMEAVQILYDNGAYGDQNSPDAKAVANIYRGEAASLLISKLLTQYAFFKVMGMLSGVALRTLSMVFAPFPGAGWIVGLSGFGLSIAMSYLLNQDEVQKWIIEQFMSILKYPGKVVGSGTGMVFDVVSGTTGGWTPTSPIPYEWKEINLEAKQEVAKKLGKEPQDTLSKQRPAQQRKQEKRAGVTPPTPEPETGPAVQQPPAAPARTPSGSEQGVDADDLIRQL